jgi:hypothetical protein
VFGAAVSVFALGLSACPEADHCDPAPAVVNLVLSQGKDALASITMSGICGVGISASNDLCLSEVACMDAGPCPCTIRIVIGHYNSPEDVCHVELRSTEGGVFQADIEVAVNPGPCLSVRLVDPTQAMIEVEFSDPN